MISPPRSESVPLMRARLPSEPAGDVAHVRVGHEHVEVDDRLEHLRLGLRDRVEKRFLAGGDERDFLRIDRVVLAVVDDHAHVLQLIAGDGAVFEHLAHAFFDGGNELARNRAALDFVDELEAAAARQRLDAQEHFAELAGAAGLLLVAVMAFGLARRSSRDRRSSADASSPRRRSAPSCVRASASGAGPKARGSRFRSAPCCARRGSTDLPRPSLCSAVASFCSWPLCAGSTARPNIGIGKSSGLRWIWSSSCESCSTASKWISSIFATAAMSPGIA